MKITLVYCNDLSAAYLDNPLTYQAPLEADFEAPGFYECSDRYSDPTQAPPEALLESIYSAFNRTDGGNQHPLLDSHPLRSMSMGDVVILDGKKYRVATFGFEKVEGDLTYDPPLAGRQL